MPLGTVPVASNRSNWVVALRSFTAQALRRRLSVMADRSPEALAFQSREGTPLTTANVRRQLRKVLATRASPASTRTCSAARWRR